MALAWFNDVFDDETADPWRIAVLMTFATLLLHTATSSTLTATVTLVLAALLLGEALTQRALFWFILALSFLAVHLLLGWPRLINHFFLQLYWLLLIGVSRLATDKQRVLQEGSRWLVGLAFSFAVLWKFLAPEFLSGAFFEFTFLTDARLGDLLSAIGLQSSEIVAANQLLISGWKDPLLPPTSGQTEVVRFIALATPYMAVWTIVIESSIAVLYIAKLQHFAWLRDAALLTFIASTYPVMPLIGFAWLLLAIGYSASALRTSLRLPLYLSVFLLISLVEARSLLLTPIQHLFSLL